MHAALSGVHQSVSAPAMCQRYAWLLISRVKVFPFALQIMSSRLKMLLMPAGRGLVPPFDQNPPEEAANMAPVIMTGLWEDRKADQGFQGRLR